MRREVDTGAAVSTRKARSDGRGATGDYRGDVRQDRLGHLGCGRLVKEAFREDCSVVHPPAQPSGCCRPFGRLARDTIVSGIAKHDLHLARSAYEVVHSTASLSRFEYDHTPAVHDQPFDDHPAYSLATARDHKDRPIRHVSIVRTAVETCSWQVAPNEGQPAPSRSGGRPARANSDPDQQAVIRPNRSFPPAS